MGRKLVWIAEPHFRGWGCSECAWVFSPVGPPVGESIDEMKANYERKRLRDYLAHLCDEHPGARGIASG